MQMLLATRGESTLKERHVIAPVEAKITGPRMQCECNTEGTMVCMFHSERAQRYAGVLLARLIRAAEPFCSVEDRASYSYGQVTTTQINSLRDAIFAAQCHADIEILSRLREQIAQLRKALIWCSAAKEFQSDGIARKGWEK